MAQLPHEYRNPDDRIVTKDRNAPGEWVVRNLRGQTGWAMRSQDLDEIVLRIGGLVKGAFLYVIEASPRTPEVFSGLVAYYPFDRTLHDNSGNGNHGIPYGYLEFTPGVSGQALKLYGTDRIGYVRVPNSASLTFKDAFTVACFVRVDSNLGQTSHDCSGKAINGEPQCLVAKRGDRFGMFLNLFMDQTKHTLTIVCQINAYTTSGGVSVHAQIPYVLHKWIHLAVSYSSRRFAIYINGKEIASREFTATDLTTVNREDMYIGIQNNAGAVCLPLWYPLNGAIDELRIYNRAPSPMEIAELANAQTVSADFNYLATALLGLLAAVLLKLLGIIK